MSSPALQLYVRDWYMSTRGLSSAARGIYMDLICLAWEQDGLPEDRRTLAGMVSETPARFNKLWAEIEDKWFVADDGKLRNARQEKQRTELEKMREQKRLAGLASAAARNGNG